MSTLAPPQVMAPTPPMRPMRRFSVAEYHRMIDDGLLTENDAVELLEGWIVCKMLHRPSHDNAIELLDDCLRGLLPPTWSIRKQSAITTDDSEPEPDIAIVQGTARSRQGRHPQRADIGLIVEVSDTTLEFDRGDKRRLYARANVREYWILNLVDRQLEVHSDPSGSTDAPHYQTLRTFSAGEAAPLTLDGVCLGNVAIDDVLP